MTTPSGPYWRAKIHKHFDLSLTPSIGMSGFSHTFPLELTTAIQMQAKGTSKAEFDLSLTPTIGMDAVEKYRRDFALDLVPALGLDAGERYTRTFGLGLTPSIGMAGVGHQAPIWLGGSGVAHTGLSFTETVPAGTSLAILWATHSSNNLSEVLGANIGGVGHNMTNQYSWLYSGGSGGGAGEYLSCLTLLSPPLGTQAIVITDPNNIGGFHYACMEYYTNVGSLGTASRSTIASASMARGIGSSVVIRTYAHCFASGAGNLSAATQNVRSPAADLTGPGSLVTADAQGNGGTLTFAATQSDTTKSGASIYIPLIPPP